MQARYKSKFCTSFLCDTIGLGSVFVVALCILWVIYMMNYSKNVDSIILPAALSIWVYGDTSDFWRTYELFYPYAKDWSRR